MAEFTVNATRVDPYKNFKFRVKWDGKYVAYNVSEHNADEAVMHVIEVATGQSYDAALRDGLTKCYNKKFFIDRLETEFATLAPC